MAKDISRYLHQPRKHYSGVRMQQGVPFLDSDFNESTRLHEEERRRALLFLIGPNGTPDEGFGIGRPLPLGGPVPEQTGMLRFHDALPIESIQINGVPTLVRAVSVRAGHVYLGGLRFDLEAPEHIAFQRDFLQMQPDDLPRVELESSPEESSPGGFGPFRDFYYLHCWEQVVTAVEDEEILEKALGGPDTSVRIRRTGRVQILSNLEEGLDSCGAAWEALLAQLERDNARFNRNTHELESLGRLRLAFREGESDDLCAPCNPDPGARYLGAENQTLRVMQTSATRFVWAFDNSAPLYRVRVTGLAAPTPTRVEVEMLTPPRDEEHWPMRNCVTEIVGWEGILQGGELRGEENPHFKKIASEVGVFSRVDESYDPNTRRFTLDLSAGIAEMQRLVHRWDPRHPDAAELNVAPEDEDVRYFYLRLWHVAEDLGQIELPLNTSEDGPTLGDTGIVPIFERAGRRGDFWIASLRPETPERIVPFELLTDPDGIPPHGPHHYYAPVALLHGEDTELLGARDCRARMRPNTDGSCATRTVGDGITSIGDFGSIQDAIDSLPADGGRVAVLPGFYQQDVVIDTRRGVVLEGCGDSTILRAPPGSPPGDQLISIVNSAGVTVSGFTLQVDARAAVDVRDTTDVSLVDLSIVAGRSTGAGVFQPGAGASDNAPLIRIENAGLVNIRSAIIEPSRRPAIALDRCQYAQVLQVTIVGDPEAAAPPARPMIGVENSELVNVRDCILHTYAQVAVGVLGAGNADVTVDEVSVVAGPRNSGEQARSGIDVEGGERIRVHDCRVVMDHSYSEHAGIVVLGRGVVIENNHVEALRDCYDPDSPEFQSPEELIVHTFTRVGFPTVNDDATNADDEPLLPITIRALDVEAPLPPDGCQDLRALAWGGIHVRGGAAQIQVRGNTIVGGIGHGITLGSVLWFEFRGSPAVADRREGAGRAQVLTREDGTYVVSGDIEGGFDEGIFRFHAVDEGPIRDIAILDNHIEGMFTNGISHLTVYGLRNGDLMEVQRARIERNTISGNVTRPHSAMRLAQEVLPFPGSSQGSGVSIPVLPHGGIVLAVAADGIDIRDNALRGNGVSAVLPFVGIFLLAGDAIVIAGNRVTGNGGLAREFRLHPGVRAGIAVMLAGTGTASTQGDLGDLVENEFTLDNDGSALRVVNNTVRHPEGRALYAVGTGPMCIQGNFFSSQGNHGADTTADRFLIGDVVYLHNLGRSFEAFEIERATTTDQSGNLTSFQHPDLPNTPPLLSLDDTRGYLTNTLASPQFFVGEGGHLAFNDNQVVYDWLVRLTHPNAPLSTFSVALISMDHVGAQGNQLSMRIRGVGLSSSPRPDPEGRGHLLSQLYALGATVDVSRNRVSEAIPDSDVSILTSAMLLNNTTQNMGTHQTQAFHAAGDRIVDNRNVDITAQFLLRQPNMNLFSNAEGDSGIRAALQPLQLRYLQLLRDRHGARNPV